VDSGDASKQRHENGRQVRAARRTVRAFMAEWRDAVGDSLKPSTRQNYLDYTRAYVDPIIGDRRLQDITVPVLNLLYRRLLTEGRVKVDRNAAMYTYWAENQHEREGLGPSPTKIVAALRGDDPRRAGGGAALPARTSARRCRAWARTQDGQERAPNAAPGVTDAVAWDYLVSNPAEHASLPREQRGNARNRPKPWTVDELTAWLRLALSDRFAAMWLLAATTGMRRSEPAGVDRELLDLDAATLAIEDTRVVVAGQTIDSDGKSNAGVREISLDTHTVELLRAYLAVLDTEQEVFGKDYDTSHGKLMRYEDGRRLHADTGTRRFNRLVDLAGVRRIRLHDVRHTYARRSRWTAECTPRSSATGSAMHTRGSRSRSTGTGRLGPIATPRSWSPASSGGGWTTVRRPVPDSPWSQILSQPHENGPRTDRPGAVLPGSGGRIRTYDLWVMSPASYRAAPPRVAVVSTTVHLPVGRPCRGVPPGELPQRATQSGPDRSPGPPRERQPPRGGGGPACPLACWNCCTAWSSACNACP
jgi:integrase